MHFSIFEHILLWSCDLLPWVYLHRIKKGIQIQQPIHANESYSLSAYAKKKKSFHFLPITPMHFLDPLGRLPYAWLVAFKLLLYCSNCDRLFLNVCGDLTSCFAVGATVFLGLEELHNFGHHKKWGFNSAFFSVVVALWNKTHHKCKNKSGDYI